jgi:hypothetical protein
MSTIPANARRDQPPPWLDTVTLAWHLCISTETIPNWVAAGILPPPRKRGGKLMWRAARGRRQWSLNRSSGDSRCRQERARGRRRCWSLSTPSHRWRRFGESEKFKGCAKATQNLLGRELDFACRLSWCGIAGCDQAVLGVGLSRGLERQARQAGRGGCRPLRQSRNGPLSAIFSRVRSPLASRPVSRRAVERRGAMMTSRSRRSTPDSTVTPASKSFRRKPAARSGADTKLARCGHGHVGTSARAVSPSVDRRQAVESQGAKPCLDLRARSQPAARAAAASLIGAPWLARSRLRPPASHRCQHDRYERADGCSQHPQVSAARECVGGDIQS